LFYRFSLNGDDNEFEIIKSPSSTKEFKQFNDDIDDEKASTIIENEETNDNNDSTRIRTNSIPTPLSTFKTAILNGILVENNK